MGAGRQTWSRTFSSLRIPGYRLMFLSMMASFLGMQMEQVARGWLTWELTGSAANIGIVASAWGLPALILSLFGGVVADRMDKRKVLMAAQGMTTLLATAVAVLVLTDLIEIWHLVVMGLVQGTVFAFQMPARQAIVPEIVGEKELMNAVALNSAAMNLNRILGPAIAGPLVAVAFIDIQGVLFVVAGLYCLSLFALYRLDVTTHVERRLGPMLADLFSGITYIKSSWVLTTLIGTGFLLIMFGMPIQMMMPVFAGDVFHVGPRGFGFLQAASGIGAITGTLWVASRASTMTNRWGTQLTTALAFGLCLFLFAFTAGAFGALWLGLLILPFVGLTSQIFMSLNNTMIMSHTDQEIRGRVMSVYMMTWSLMPLSLLPMGLFADSLGIANTVAGAAMVIIGCILLLRVARPATQPQFQ